MNKIKNNSWFWFRFLMYLMLEAVGLYLIFENPILSGFITCVVFLVLFIEWVVITYEYNEFMDYLKNVTLKGTPIEDLFKNLN